MITPQDLPALPEALPAELEKRIDEVLRAAHRQRKWPATIPLGGTYGQESWGPAIVRHYERAGWSVVVIINPRNGDYLEFAMPDIYRRMDT